MQNNAEKLKESQPTKKPGNPKIASSDNIARPDKKKPGGSVRNVS